MAQYQSGCVRFPRPKLRTVVATMKDSRPNGNWRNRKVRSFQVAGSARRARRRSHQPPLGSGRYGLAISLPVSVPITRRSTPAIQPQA